MDLAHFLLVAVVGFLSLTAQIMMDLAPFLAHPVAGFLPLTVYLLLVDFDQFGTHRVLGRQFAALVLDFAASTSA